MPTTLENTLIRFNDGTTQSTAATSPPAASTSVAGIVQLSTATNSTSTTLAATPSAVKAAYDLAAAATTTSEAKLKTGAAAGTHYQRLSDIVTTNKTSYTKAVEARVLVSGTIRTLLDLRAIGGVTAYARIYKNGAAVGTARSTATQQALFTEDLAFNAGDLIQVYAYCTSSSGSVSFKIAIGTSASSYGLLATPSEFLI